MLVTPFSTVVGPAHIDVENVYVFSIRSADPYRNAILTLDRPVEPNAFTPTVSTEWGSTGSEVRAVQNRNAQTPTVISPVGKTTEVRLVQDAKAVYPRDVSPAGNTMEVSPVQPSNAPLPIVVSPAGKTTEVRPLHARND